MINAMAPENIVWSNVQRYVTPLMPGRFAYMSDADNARVEAIRQRRQLFRGLHREYFLGENRTQFPVLTLKVNGIERGIYVPYNLLGLSSLKFADLLFGEPPAIKSEDEAVQAAIESIVRRSHLSRTFFQAAVTCSWAGDTYLEIVARQEGAYVSAVNADEVFPRGLLGPSGQYAEYVRYATTKVGAGDNVLMLLLITTYRVGTITREVYQLDDSGTMRPGKVALNAWPFAGPVPQEVEATGLDACSLIWVPNQIVEGEAVSDYEPDVIELQDLLNAKHSQLARCLSIHANPRMFFPTGSADNDGNVRASDEAFFGDTKDAKPEYVQQAGEPTAAMADRDFAVASLCVRLETTPEMLGIKNNAAADSARKMRLAASSPLAKTERRTAYWLPAIQQVMALAVRVELGRYIDPNLIGVELREGLPEDEFDTAEIISALRAADVLSDERALAMLGLDAGAIDEELKRLKAKRDAATPSVLLGEPSAPSAAEAAMREAKPTAADAADEV